MLRQQLVDWIGLVPRQLRQALSRAASARALGDALDESPQAPVAYCAQVALGMVREDGLADVQEIDAAIELARAGLGPAVGALGDDAHDAVLLTKEREDLRGFAVLGLAKTDAAVGNEGHT